MKKRHPNSRLSAALKKRLRDASEAYDKEKAIAIASGSPRSITLPKIAKRFGVGYKQLMRERELIPVASIVNESTKKRDEAARGVEGNYYVYDIAWGGGPATFVDRRARLRDAKAAARAYAKRGSAGAMIIRPRRATASSAQAAPYVDLAYCRRLSINQELTDSSLYFWGYCDVSCTFQSGSNGDVLRGDGAEWKGKKSFVFRGAVLRISLKEIEIADVRFDEDQGAEPN
jgi:hypothetical protein